MTATPTTIRGVDVYHGDTPLDWHALAAAGVRFAYIKATQGTGYADPNFHDNKARARSVGIIPGAYHFYDPKADPLAQARHLMAHAPQEKGDLVYGWDVETAGPSVGARSRAGADEIKRITGRFPIPYSGDAFYQANLKAHFPEDDFTLWIARYGHPPVTKCAIWQFTDAGRVAGNPHPLDTDTFYGSLDALMAHTV